MEITPEIINFLANTYSSELTCNETGDLAIALLADAWEMCEDEVRMEISNALRRRYGNP